MTEATVRTILRLIAVVTTLVGAIMLMMTVVALVQFGGRAELGMAPLLLTQSVVAAEGLLLYVLSGPMAQKIVQ
jgi:hypothetical protein